MRRKLYGWKRYNFLEFLEAVEEKIIHFISATNEMPAKVIMNKEIWDHYKELMNGCFNIIDFTDAYVFGLKIDRNKDCEDLAVK